MRTVEALIGEEQQLSQAHKDAWQAYMRTIASPEPARWDNIILTAANEQQARGFQAQIELRRRENFLPGGTHFGIVPDPVGERVGNGGAMLGALRYVLERHAGCEGVKTLVILSSGDSKRVPQYSPLGKVFSPVPRLLPNGRCSTLFDEILLSMAAIPQRLGAGMLVLSGDVMLSFDAKRLAFPQKEAAAISFAENVEAGAHHGVFLGDDQGYIAKVWHKQKPEVLDKHGAVDADACVQIDTGAVFFPTNLLKALARLIQDAQGRITQASFRRYVNGRVAPSLYVDFFYPLVREATYEGYLAETPEGSPCPELLEMRRQLWEILRPFGIRLLAARPGRFIHFGSTAEVVRLMAEGIEKYQYLGWKKHVGSRVADKNAAGYNAVADASVVCEANAYLEDSVVSRCRIGDSSILSGVEVEGISVPRETVLHAVRLDNGQYTARIFGIRDSIKESLSSGATLFGRSLKAWMESNGIAPEELWEPGEERLLWTARLFRVCTTMQEAVEAALELQKSFEGQPIHPLWLRSERESLNSSFVHADGRFIAQQRERIHQSINAAGGYTQ